MRLARQQFGAGAAIGLLWGVGVLLAESWLGLASPVSRLLALLLWPLPVAIQNWFLGAAEAWAKAFALGGSVLSAALVSGVVTVVAARCGRYRGWLLAAWGFGAGAALLVLGDTLRPSWLLVTGVGSLGLFLGLWVASDPEEVGYSASRRRLTRTALGLATVVGLAAAARALWRLGERARAPSLVDERGLPPALTPIGDFYVVSKNVRDPVVDASQWRLRVGGLVQRPLELDLVALRRRPAVRQIVTLECISNEVWGPYISNGEWIGVPLRDIVLEAGPVEPVVDVVLRAADGYSDSIPFSVALQPAVLLAYGLNGETLPHEHGFPLRLVVPGIYGMKNVKWITEIELTPGDYQGFWQQRGWSDDARVQIHSRIDVPRGGARIPVGRPLFVGGIAFAGDRGISRVELSTDGGTTWQTVEQETPLSPYAWVRWWTHWQPTSVGRYQLVVRAWDGQGVIQDGIERPPLPDGATGWHRITIEAVPAA